MRNPGLDPTLLRSLRPPRRDLATIRRRIADHLQRHDGYLAFSGGKDSLITLHLTLSVEPNIPVAFFDSGLEYPETYRYLAELSDRWDLNLDLIPAQPTALEMLRAGGCWDHRSATTTLIDMRSVLIDQPAATAHIRHGAGELWGVRAAESHGRRMLYARALARETAACTCRCDTSRDRRGHHGGTVRRADGTVAYGPVWDWADDEIWSYLVHHEIPANPVYGKLRALGAPPRALRLSQMLDGEHLETGRIVWLRRGWPDMFEELSNMLPRLREFV